MIIQRVIRRLPFVAQCFSSFHKFLSSHTNSILTLHPDKYSDCLKQMDHITSLQLAEKQTKNILNIIFSISNLSDAYQNIKNDLYQLVRHGEIKSQSDLDRLTKWLNNQLRINNNITLHQIRDRLIVHNKPESLTQRLDDFLKESGKQVDISALSKQIRQEFPGIQSKLIYSEIIKRFVNKNSKQSRQIWDKLSQLKPRLLKFQTNSSEQIKKHLQITQGRLRFRFPPQPNGYLHIGHAKSIRINFQTSKQKGGECFLRFDDTNPEKESEQYIQNIIQEVNWMGYQPDKITYASDYFDKLICYATQLIQKGHAYVCQSPKQQINQQRKNKLQNEYRFKTKQYSLERFPNLKQNQVLRLRLDPKASNPTLRDPIIYRYKSKPHPRTGSKYKIYPTYDYAHCICDSIEHIDYSLCSLQFQIRRELYYTILHLLNLYKPKVWEYSRLNIQGSLLSKRKITKLVEDKQVQGWDDPRLMTLAGLRNRGYSPSMIKNFIDKVNASRTGNQNIIQSNVLTIQMKRQLFQKAERTMAVLNPIKIKILNLQPRQIQIPLFPADLSKGFRKLKLTKDLYIQESQKISLGTIVGLKYIGIIKITRCDSEIEGEIIHEENVKSKTKHIHWVPSTYTTCNIAEFNCLVTTSSDGQQTFNQNNSQIFVNSMVAPDLSEEKIYQFERLGYYKFYKGRIICCCRL